MASCAHILPGHLRDLANCRPSACKHVHVCEDYESAPSGHSMYCISINCHLASACHTIHQDPQSPKGTPENDCQAWPGMYCSAKLAGVVMLLHELQLRQCLVQCRTARWRALVAGLAAGPTLLLTGCCRFWLTPELPVISDHQPTHMRPKMLQMHSNFASQISTTPGFRPFKGLNIQHVS